MSLAERLGQASIQAPGPTRARRDATGEEYLSEYVELKQEVQDCLMDSVGQQLYSGRIDQTRLEGLVFEAIQTVLARDPRPLSGGDRARIVQEVIDSVLGNGPLEPLLRDPDVTEIMVNRLRHDLHGEGRPDLPDVHAVRGREPPAADHRSHRVAGRATRRRGQPDGGRPPARRQSRQRRHPAGVHRRLLPDDPQVRRGAVHRIGPHHHGHPQPPGDGLHARPA